MARLDISEKRIPQDGRIQIAFHKHGRPIDFRVSTLPTLFGDHGLGCLLKEGGHGKSPKCLDGNLGDFGEFSRN